MFIVCSPYLVRIKIIGLLRFHVYWSDRYRQNNIIYHDNKENCSLCWCTGGSPGPPVCESYAAAVFRDELLLCCSHFTELLFRLTDGICKCSSELLKRQNMSLKPLFSTFSTVFPPDDFLKVTKRHTWNSYISSEEGNWSFIVNLSKWGLYLLRNLWVFLIAAQEQPSILNQTNMN